MMNVALKELIRPLVVISVAIAGMLGVDAWSRYYPESDIFAVAGMPGARADEGRVCEKIRRMSARGPRRVREVRCVPSREVVNQHGTDPVTDGRQFRVVDIFALPYRRWEMVHMWFWSRQPYMASVHQYWRDSTGWAAAVDSLHRAMTSRGATKLDCDDVRLGPAVGLFLSERWQDGRYQLDVRGSRIGGETPSFSLSVTAAAASRMSGC